MVIRVTQNPTTPSWRKTCSLGTVAHQFVRSSQLFRKVLSNEYTIAGGGSVLLADNVEAAKIPFHPHPTASR